MVATSVAIAGAVWLGSVTAREKVAELTFPDRLRYGQTPGIQYSGLDPAKPVTVLVVHKRGTGILTSTTDYQAGGATLDTNSATPLAFPKFRGASRPFLTLWPNEGQIAIPKYLTARLKDGDSAIAVLQGDDLLAAKFFKLKQVFQGAEVEEKVSTDANRKIYQFLAKGSDRYVLLLSGTDGRPLIGTARWMAAQGLNVVTFDYIRGFTMAEGCISQINVDEIRRYIAERSPLRGRRFDIVGVSAGADLALILANQSGEAIDKVYALAPTAWHFNGSKGPLCALPDSPWRLNGAPVPYTLYFPKSTTGLLQGGLRQAGLTPQVVPMRATLNAMSTDQRRALQIAVSGATSKVNLFGGGMDALTVARESVDTLCPQLPNRGRCAVFPKAGHELIGVPGTPVMCATPMKDSAHHSQLETCLETAVARDTIMTEIVEP